jgi:F0F1-type ATP synthase epsilon subunit
VVLSRAGLGGAAVTVIAKDDRGGEISILPGHLAAAHARSWPRSTLPADQPQASGGEVLAAIHGGFLSVTDEEA